MPPVTAETGEIYQVKLISRFENQEHLNILHFAAMSPTDDVQLRLLKAIVDCFLLNMMPGLSADFTTLGAVGHRVSPTVGPEVSYFHNNASVANSGLAAGDHLPSFNSCVISIHTVRGGRSGRGRMFIGGIPEGSTTGSMLLTSAAFWAAVTAFVACVVSTFFAGDPPGANSWQFGILSRKIGGVTEPYAAAGFAAATNLIPQQLIASTRSRKVGHGS